MASRRAVVTIFRPIAGSRRVAFGIALPRACGTPDVVLPAPSTSSSSEDVPRPCRGKGAPKAAGRFWDRQFLAWSGMRPGNDLAGVPCSFGFGRQCLPPSSSCRRLVSKPQRSIVDEDSDQPEFLDFPGINVHYSYEMKFIPEVSDEPVPCYRVLNDVGQELHTVQANHVHFSLARTMYSHMITLQTMDLIFYDAQRQGRFSFYMTTRGEEAINIASAAALHPDDFIFAQYREPGLLLWRGFKLQDFADQCFSNASDAGKGRQMPIHYGSKALNYSTISSPLATQLPHAVGAAYAMKMAKQRACTVAFFGEGATSEGDFHAAMNFAAVLEVPVLFICRNNGWAISTPSTQQYKGDGLVGKGRAYGMKSIRVDGNDALAVYGAVKEARRMAVEESRPIFIEALTYRVGHHSTSDDSSRYRSGAEIEHWRDVRDPVLRFRRWIEGKGWWNSEEEQKIRAQARKEVLSAMTLAESKRKPPLSDLFTDVYDKVPSNLREQEESLRQTVARYPSLYPSNTPV